MINAEDINRQKAAMVIFALEKAIGDYVKGPQHQTASIETSGTFLKISQRLDLTQADSPKLLIHHAVASSYLDEVVSLAIECSKGTTDQESLKALQNLASQLDLSSIRNTVAHPNRPFPDCYWYRTASIASDPVIEKLALTSVRLALQAAEDGKITPPPEDWFQVQYSAIRNNLPRQFEHETTGLIGRQKEKRDLLLSIRSGKYSLIAVVAPGGLGKTSLALDALRDCALEPSSQNWCDAIVFVSLKQEKLTADGIVHLNASQTIIELQTELFTELLTLFPDIESSDFPEICLDLSKQRIFLCIDNLETILVNQQESFTDFFESLPERWRILITSRITVDGAKTLPIGALNQEGARSLAYRYITTKGLEAPTDQAVNQFISASSGNPLALRLIIDRFSNGYPVPVATAQAEKDIVAFSYRNLVEVLSDNALLILEALFVKDSFVRGELVELLGLDSDSTAEAVRQLTRTSLVTRHSDGTDERFSLSPSVRDLLRDHPRNLAVRNHVKLKIDSQAKTVRQHKTIQSQYGFSQFSEDFIPNDCPPNLGAVLVTAIKLLRADSHSHSQLIAALNRLSQTIKNYPTNALALVVLGRLHLEVKDDLGAESSFRLAISADPESPVARIVYQSYLLRRERPDEAFEILQSLIDQGWAHEEKSDEFTSRRIWSYYFRSLTDTRQFQPVLDITPEPSSKQWFIELVRCAQARCHILKVAAIHSEYPTQAFEGLVEASRLLKHPAKHERIQGYWWMRNLRFLFRELIHFFDVNSAAKFPHTGMRTILECTTQNIVVAYEDMPLGAIRSEAEPILRILRNLVGAESEDSFSAPWIRTLLGLGSEQHEMTSELQAEGYKILTVYKVPYCQDNIPAFVFTEDTEKNRYFIPKAACRNFDYLTWAQLRNGSKVAARSFNTPASREQYPISSDVVLIIVK
jgi:hypothetical protein